MLDCRGNNNFGLVNIHIECELTFRRIKLCDLLQDNVKPCIAVQVTCIEDETSDVMSFIYKMKSNGPRI